MLLTMRRSEDSPKSRLAAAVGLAFLGRTARRAHVASGEASAIALHLLVHVGLGGGCTGLLTSRLALKVLEVLETHGRE
jgi:hypothetical protein